MSAVTAASEGVYSNDVLYSNLGGDPLYSNVAEVRNVSFESYIIWIKRKHSFSKEILLPSGERGAGALGGAWSLGAGGQNGWCRRQGSGQGPDLLPPASIWTTPLGAPHGGLLCFLSCWIRTIRFVVLLWIPEFFRFAIFIVCLWFSLSYSWTQVSNNHKIKCFIIFVGSGVWLKMILVVYSPSFSFGSFSFVDPELKFSGSGILIWLRI